MQLKQGATIANRYVISEILGKGGMAIVYKASDIKLDRDVTLKVMREEFVKDDDFINRFNVEAKAAAKLTHQNIVNVYDVGKYGDIYFIVMEYIDGVTLKDIIRRRGTLTNEEVLGVSIQIAQALEVAHRNNIVHRDIKPQNILINSKGDVKVTDFGIARAINANTVTSGNNTMGSVHYFSPEQARGGYIDQKSDIYSLGITMYEMATGELPFDDETVVAIALKHISEPLPKIAYINENIDESVIEIIEKATQKVGMARFDTVELMNNSLKRALINLGRQNREEYQEEVVEEVKPIFSPEQSHTLVLSDDDITEIRTKAMTAFFDNVDVAEITMLTSDKKKRPKQPREDEYNPYEDDEKGGSGKYVFLGVLLAVILSFGIAVGVFKYINGSTVLVDVPNFVGMTMEEAKAAAKEYRITIDEDSKRYNDEYAPGVIVDQDYVYGQDKIRVGGTITVITSLGHESQTVPDVVGETVDAAFAALDELGFNIEYKYEYNDSVKMNIVQKQVPEGGTAGESGDTITIYISKGAESTTVNVPNVKGKTEADAKKAIEGNKLVFGGVTYDYNKDYKDGEVFAQTPTAGNEVQENSVVSIFVSKGPKPEEVPTESPAPTEGTENPTNTEVPVTGGSTQTYTINAIDGLQPTDKVTIKFVKIATDGKATVAYENTVSASELPISVGISGKGEERIQLSTKINDGPYQLQGDSKVNFGE